MGSPRLLVMLPLLAGCVPELVRIRIDAPRGAKVTIPAGFSTPKVKATVPFVADYEDGARSKSTAYPLLVRLDAETGRRFGADDAVTLYGRLLVYRPTKNSRGQTLVLGFPEERIRALVRGDLTFIATFKNDPHVFNGDLAELILSLEPF